jgi:PAS domain S-box-containing protein
MSTSTQNHLYQVHVKTNPAHFGQSPSPKIKPNPKNQKVTLPQSVQEALRESEERFRAIFNNAAVGIALADMQGQPLEVNQAFQDMLGYTRAELHRLEFNDFTHPEDISLDAALFAKMKKGLTNTYYLEKRYLKKDGQVVWVHVAVSLVKDLKGNPQYTIGVIRDITKRKRIEDALYQANQRMKYHFEHSPLGIIEWDPEFRIVSWSLESEKIFGWKKKEILNKKIDEIPFIYPKDQPRIGKLLMAMANGIMTTNINTNRNFRKDGSIIYCEWYNSALHDSSGKLVSVVSMVLDITGRVMIEQQFETLLKKSELQNQNIQILAEKLAKERDALKELESRKDEFLSIASHELKTPLTSIKAFAQILERRFAKAGEADSAHLLSRLNAQVDKLTDLVIDLLDVTKIDSGKLQMNKNRFRLDHLIRETVEDIQATVETNHRLIVKGELTKTIVADKYRIGQVLTNLITNAVKYSPEANRVNIDLKDGPEAAIIDIKDFGLGIVPKEQAHIFERFYRIKNSRTDGSSPGLGLGLYIASEIVKFHGGKISVRSKPGKGSVFSVILPWKNDRKS